MKRILIIAVAGAFVASPAMADLFSFTYGALTSSGNKTTFTADVIDGTTEGDVTRASPAQSAEFDDDWSEALELADFTLGMNLSGIGGGGTTAHGTGSLVATDIDGDTITADLEGDWTLPIFIGTLSNVMYNPTGGGGGTFDGDSGFANLIFGGLSGPWPGLILELTSTGLNFKTGWTTDSGAGVIATVTPVPGAVLLGLLGLSAAGWKLRRHR